MSDDLKRLIALNSKADNRPSSILLFIILLLLLTIFYWASVTELDKVVRGDGKTISEIENQLIQSSESGVITKRYVEEGDYVKKGDILFEIDPIDSRTEYEQALEKQIRLEIQQHRLLSVSQKLAPDFAKYENYNLKTFVESQANLYEAERLELENKISILEQRRLQRLKQIEELDAQSSSSVKIGELLGKEIDTLEPLVKSGSSPETNLLVLLRQKEENASIVVSSQLKIERLNAELDEITEQIIAENQQYLTAALSELPGVNDQLREVKLALPSLAARLARNSVNSTIDGVINQINFQTDEAYIRSGEVLVEIVPTGEALIVEGQIDPKDIADVLVGDQVKISLTAYDPTRYGRLDGIVQKISADAITDQQDGRTYYSVKISISSTLFEKDTSEVILLPGMVATIDILAGKRTVLDYIWQPIARTKDRALRD